MKNKIEILEERLAGVNNTLGDVDTSEFNSRTGTRNIISKDKMKNVAEVIIFLQKEIAENDSISFKEIYKKFEELAPLLNLQKLRQEYNISEKEMYMMIISNFDELESFGKNIQYIKDNQNYLELDPILDSQEKINKLKPLELQTMDVETKSMQISQNIDTLLKNYNETVQVINEKFSLYDKLISKLENK